MNNDRQLLASVSVLVSLSCFKDIEQRVKERKSFTEDPTEDKEDDDQTLVYATVI